MFGGDNYLLKYDRAAEHSITNDICNPKLNVFHEALEEILPGLMNEGNAYSVTEFREKCNKQLQAEVVFHRNREITLLLKEHFGKKHQLCST